MARKSFNETVTRIRQLDASEDQVAFEMGDEVLEQAPMGASHAHNDTEATLRRLAEESGVDYSVLDERRKVSAAIPQGVRTPSVSWSVYRQIALYAPEAERPRLIELVATKAPTQIDANGIERPTRQLNKAPRWTKDAIRTHFGKKPYNDPPGSAGLLGRALREATPEAVAEALEVPEVRRAVYDGLHRHEEKSAERKEHFIATDPIARRIDQSEAMIELERWVDALRRHLDRQIEILNHTILPRLGKAPDRDPAAMRHFLAEALTDLDHATAPIRTFVERGDSDINVFLADVLGGKRG